MTLPAGPLAGLLRDPDVTDVLVNGPGEVWADRGGGLVREPLTFSSDDDVRRLAVRLASAAGRRLDAGSPFVDARLAGGVRLHAALPPVAASGVHLSLRVHRASLLDLPALVDLGSVHPAFHDVLDALVAARLAFVISGGAGTGKTTLLGALLARAAASERILLVEDTAELTVNHPHVVRLAARPPNVEGAGEITLRDLVRQALRMRPDRVIVGEVRGPEILDMLLAANTGHDGCVTTLHANGVADVPARVEALAMLSGIPRPAAHSLLASALRVAVHLHRARDGSRQVGQLAVLERDGDLVRAVPALSWDGCSAAVEWGPGAALLRDLLDDHDRPLPVGFGQP